MKLSYFVLISCSIRFTWKFYSIVTLVNQYETADEQISHGYVNIFYAGVKCDFDIIFYQNGKKLNFCVQLLAAILPPHRTTRAKRSHRTWRIRQILSDMKTISPKYEMKIDLWYWISRRHYKIWDEITHTFPNFNNCTHVMPRSQPAVRATALACLVLRRSYVSNSASPVADWGLKVILQPPHRQRTSLAAAVPPTHRIARRKSHSEGAFNVLASCLRGTFNVRSPCHRPLVRTAVCVSEPQWHAAGALKAPLTCDARMDISSLPRVFLAR